MCSCFLSLSFILKISATRVLYTLFSPPHLPAPFFPPSLSLLPTSTTQSTTSPTKASLLPPVLKHSLVSLTGPPQSFSPHPGHLFNATIPGHSCPQNTDTSFDPESRITDINENCPNLNVARPAGRKESEALLPVIVWIYGGVLSNFNFSVTLD